MNPTTIAVWISDRSGPLISTRSSATPTATNSAAAIRKGDTLPSGAATLVAAVVPQEHREAADHRGRLVVALPGARAVDQADPAGVGYNQYDERGQGHGRAQ